jgi:hypothetical protein
VQNTSDVTAFVEVHKGPFGSDVDVDSCMFRYRSGDSAFSRWMPAQANQIEYEGTIRLYARLEDLLDGVDNLVQFQVYDLARNGPALSPEYVVKVDTVGPVILSIDPTEDEVQVDRLVTVTVRIEDAFVGVDPRTLLMRYSTAGPENMRDWQEITFKNIDGVLESRFEIEFDLGDDNLVQFRCEDQLGNEAVSDAMTIWVNRPPNAIIASPFNDQILSGDEPIILSARGSIDPDGQLLSYKWYIDHHLVSESEEAVVEGPFRKGPHLIELMVTDPLGSSDESALTVQVTEVGGPDEPTPKFFGVGLLLVIILLTVVAGASLYIWRKQQE